MRGIKHFFVLHPIIAILISAVIVVSIIGFVVLIWLIFEILFWPAIIFTTLVLVVMGWKKFIR
jgi:hypothetical protein